MSSSIVILIQVWLFLCVSLLGSLLFVSGTSWLYLLIDKKLNENRNGNGGYQYHRNTANNGPIRLLYNLNDFTFHTTISIITGHGKVPL